MEPEFELAPVQETYHKVQRASTKGFKILNVLLNPMFGEIHKYIVSFNDSNLPLQDLYSTLNNDLNIQDATEHMIFKQAVFPLVEYIFQNRYSKNIHDNFTTYEKFRKKTFGTNMKKLVHYLEYKVNSSVIEDAEDELVHEIGEIMLPIYYYYLAHYKKIDNK